MYTEAHCEQLLNMKPQNVGTIGLIAEIDTNSETLKRVSVVGTYALLSR